MSFSEGSNANNAQKTFDYLLESVYKVMFQNTKISLPIKIKCPMRQNLPPI